MSFGNLVAAASGLSSERRQDSKVDEAHIAVGGVGAAVQSARSDLPALIA